ncbi:MAG: trigger factor [Parachlamydiaceae bacterium]|nr:trigger factor [Parachlamydiaceae bacterium]
MSDTISDTAAVTKPNISEFKNDNVSVKMEKLPGCHVKVEVFISPLASKAVYSKAIKTISKEISVPGFRKGKAPTDIVLNKYKDYVEKEWKERLLRTAASEVISLSGITPYRNDSATAAELKKASLEETSEAFFAFEHAPEVPLIDLNALSLKQVEPKPVTDQEVEEQIDKLRLQAAKWEPIVDRPIEEGDYADLTIQSLDDTEEMLCENTRFVVRKDKMSSWMHRLLIGLNKDETVEGVSEQDQSNTTYDTDGNQTPFTPTKFKLTVIGIFKPILPECDEEFCKQMGCTSVEDLKGKIHKELTSNHATNARKNFEGQVIEQLLTLYPFEIPATEWNEEKNLQSERLRKKLESNEISPTEKLRLMQEAEQYISSLPNSYRLFFLAKKFAKEAKITITENELANEISHHLLLSRSSYDTLIDETMEPRKVQSMIFNHLLLHKTIQHITQHARME